MALKGETVAQFLELVNEEFNLSLLRYGVVDMVEEYRASTGLTGFSRESKAQ